MIIISVKKIETKIIDNEERYTAIWDVFKTLAKTKKIKEIAIYTDFHVIVLKGDPKVYWAKRQNQSFKQLLFKTDDWKIQIDHCLQSIELISPNTAHLETENAFLTIRFAESCKKELKVLDGQLRTRK